MQNRLLLHNFLTVLSRIAENSDFNQMTLENLAICVSPSLLWPSNSAAEVIKNKIHLVVLFLLENLMDLFGKEVAVVVIAASSGSSMLVGLEHLSVSTETLEGCERQASETENSAVDSETDDLHNRSQAVNLLMVDDCNNMSADSHMRRSVSDNQLSIEVPIKRSTSETMCNLEKSSIVRTKSCSVDRSD